MCLLLFSPETLPPSRSLLQTPEKVALLVAAMVRGAGGRAPVTVKMRSGLAPLPSI